MESVRKATEFSNRALLKITLWILPTGIALAMGAAGLLKSFK